MKISVKEFQTISKISNSIYDEIKIEFLFHSNKLEGSTFSKENLSVLLEEKKVVGEHFVDDIVETRNSLELFDKVIETLQEPLDKYLLWDWHRTLKKGSIDDEIGNIGHWKKYSNMLKNTDLKLCEPHEVENRIYNLVEDWKEGNKDIVSIAEFHKDFEYIHPFQDGNGRIGRYIILKQCIENNIDLIAIDNEYNKEYKQALYTAQSKDNIKPLINVFEKCQERLDNKLYKYKSILEEIEKSDLEVSDNEGTSEEGEPEI